MHVGIAHHFGWAIAVTASTDFQVVDRRRIALVEPGVPTAPFHSGGTSLDDIAFAELLANVRASAARQTNAALDELQAACEEPVLSLSLRAWPSNFPADLPTLRRVPYESRADSVMYRQVLAQAARSRGWAVCYFEPKAVEREAEAILGARATDILDGPRAQLGPPWTKDHRMALAAAIVAASRPASAT